MSQIDSYLSEINEKFKNPKKKELWDFIKMSLHQIGEINDLYKSYFEGEDAKLPLIEERLENISLAYVKLFPQGVTDTSVIDILNGQITDIKKYHTELLEDEDSIKSDIEDSQDKITKFYHELFGADSSGMEEDITIFYKKLTEPDGIKEKTEDLYKKITDKYQELFTSLDGESSIIDELENNIHKIDIYKKDVETRFIPEIEKAKASIINIQNDINTKSEDISALLSDATVKSLADGYMESKYEYSKYKNREYPDELSWVENLPIYIYNLIGRHITSFLYYLMFILPLIAVSLVFINEETAKIVLSSLTRNEMLPTALELIYVKTVISIPLIWIAWYGQRNISQRKRLFEEYNHKLKVVQMYILFNAGDKTYYLSNKNKDRLASVLLDAIEHNPAQYLGRGETIIDKITERFYVEGYYKKLKDEINKKLPSQKSEIGKV